MSSRDPMSPMEMEPVLDFDDPTKATRKQQIPMMRETSFLENICKLIIAYISYYRKVTIPVGSVLCILFVIFFLEFMVGAVNKKHVANISHDYSDTHSVYELKMQQIEHWCLSGANDNCRCDDPTVPMSRENAKGWVKAHKKNKKLAEDKAWADVDVVMLGGQAMEDWNGREVGELKEDLTGTNNFFKKTFTKNGGGEVEGIAMGIKGDSISNLLWRVKHGEMPDSLNPAVWWIHIGDNDLLLGQCSEEAVLLGILRLAEEIATQKPDSVVVVNSLIPSTKTIKPKHHEKKFQIWHSIRVINEQLALFTTKHTEFKFFDTTNLFFASPPPKGKGASSKDIPALKEDLVSSKGQLTTAGHKAWGKAILGEVKKIVEAKELADEQYKKSAAASGDDYYKSGDDETWQNGELDDFVGFLDDVFTDDYAYGDVDDAAFFEEDQDDYLGDNDWGDDFIGMDDDM